MRNKIWSVFIIGLLSIFVLSGCSEEQNNPMETITDMATKNNGNENTSSNSRFTVIAIDEYTNVLIDKESKVQYLKVVRNAGFDGGVDISPLYQANGKPYVGTEVSKNRFTIETIDKYTFIITDKETKVQYLKIVRNAGFDGGLTLTPLLNADGGLFLSEIK